LDDYLQYSIPGQRGKAGADDCDDKRAAVLYSYKDVRGWSEDQSSRWKRPN